jgi:GTP-binding protein Era
MVIARMSEAGPISSREPEAGGFRSGFVSLSGRPNVGKSTLLNRLVGEKVSIVSPISQTTRRVIRAVSRTPDVEVIFLDTPGMHRPQHRLNREMVRQAREALAEVDLVAMIVSGPEGFGPGDSYLLRLLTASRTPAFLVINKIDRMPRRNLLPLMDEANRRHAWKEIFPCSALSGEGCDELREACRQGMPPGGPYFDTESLSDLPERLMLGELIREQVLQRTRQEIPHCTAVLVETLQRTHSGEIRVAATLFAEKDSQKGILIGRGGEMLKAVGVASRKEMMALLKTPVHRSLQVKVKKSWRDDPQMLRLLEILARD